MDTRDSHHGRPSCELEVEEARGKPSYVPAGGTAGRDGREAAFCARHHLPPRFT